jgi:hypothetical protein
MTAVRAGSFLFEMGEVVLHVLGDFWHDPIN